MGDRQRLQVLVLNQISAHGLKRLPAEIYSVGKDVAEPDAVLLRSADMHGMAIPASVKAIGRAGAGTNNIPVPLMTARGVPVFNTPGANANAVKELVLAGMLMAARNLPSALRFVASLEPDDGRHGPGGRGRQEGLRRLRTGRPHAGHRRPRQDRLPGGRRGHQARHARARARPRDHRRCRLEPAGAGEEGRQRGRGAAPQRLRVAARAAGRGHARPRRRRQHRPDACRRGAAELLARGRGRRGRGAGCADGAAPGLLRLRLPRDRVSTATIA